MINAERLLGSIISEVTRSSLQNNSRKHGSSHRASNNYLSSLSGHLLSGKGLMTAIGLGVGAYEILKSSSTDPGAGNRGTNASPPPPPPPPPTIPAGHLSSPPPPPPPPVTGEVTQPAPASQSQGDAGQKLALRMIQVMIASAYADGHLDAGEEKEILTRLRSEELDREEKAYILSQFHNPKSIAELTAGIDDPQVKYTMYAVAASTVVVDSAEERAWLDRFAQALSISQEMQKYLEER